MAHMGKVLSDLTYSLEEPPEAYTNPSIHACIMEYMAAARAHHGIDYDLCTQEIDADLVMRQGGGKKHGRMWIANSVINSSGLSLTRNRAGSAATDPPIRPRVSSSQQQVDTLQVSSWLLAVH